ncbi:MAG: tRNA uridine-5-carboxymethylaminomethyl(34) synthesis GTPase MnmE [Gammaproteobacteria bacterium]|nr:tRNA uridine-5-carboxymethylaminomethyl(34) synthesis GTPase MnmE [Gammaproteobacteria bacterium]MDH3534326.1 tRNA uridine-5-carboxymethylaminomethyl(34) synthesis GTPase MnmE [Gammaproteobacteria bacterium]
MSAQETIVAIATPPGTGGIGILRLSGPHALAIGEALSASKIAPGRIQFRRFYDADGDLLDHGICLYFKAPHSYTGEDSVEIQAHGGPVVLDMLLQRLGELGARLARAGEFSERAFLNGKLDLTQAEAIADLIEAGSRAASRAALRSLEGRFSRQVNALVDEVIDLRTYIEAALDFAEEEIDFLDNSDISHRLAACSVHLQNLLDQAEHGRRLQEGLTVSLAGLPNAGKSSLLNYLAGYEAAIVTEIEGTTRDVLREHISLKGIPLKVSDTAGLRESQNPVEQEGIRRAWDSIAKADVVLYLVDSSRGLTVADRQIIDKLPADNLQLVFSKCDLPAADDACPDDALVISTVSGEGIESLIQRITGQAADYNQDNQAFMARRRHVDALIRARDCIDQAADTFATTRSGELMAEDLRAAQRYLNEITGEFTSDDLLGKIFSSFCIGK